MNKRYFSLYGGLEVGTNVGNGNELVDSDLFTDNCIFTRSNMIRGLVMKRGPNDKNIGADLEPAKKKQKSYSLAELLEQVSKGYYDEFRAFADRECNQILSLPNWGGSCNTNMQNLGLALYGTNITSINITCQIGPQRAIELVRALSGTRVTSLRLVNSNIDSLAAIKIVELLTYTNITHLDLSANPISSQGAVGLLKMLNYTNITSLGFGNNDIGLQGTISLASGLIGTNLTHLDLTNNNIDSHAAAELARVLKYTNIRDLNLAFNNVGPQGTIELAKYLQGSNIVSLELRNNNIGPEASIALAKSFKDTNVTAINLLGNEIGTQGSIALVKSLKDTNVTFLNLGWNEIDPRGAVEIAKAIKDTKVTHLNLSGCKIGSLEAIDLALALKHSSVTSLELRSNGIDLLGTIGLVTALKLTHITTLDLGHNEIEGKGVLKLAEVLKCTNIVQLKLDRNNINPADYEAINKVLETNKSKQSPTKFEQSENEGVTKYDKEIDEASLTDVSLKVEIEDMKNQIRAAGSFAKLVDANDDMDLVIAEQPEYIKAVKFPPDVKADKGITGGIANKYLLESNRVISKLPEKIAFGNKKESRSKTHVECIRLLDIIAGYNEQKPPQHHQITIENTNCRLQFFTTNPHVSKSKPCVFIMAGRNSKACFIPPHEDIRVILIFSKNDITLMPKALPPTIDYMVIEALSSPSHGDFKEEDLGLITPRRISAFLFAQYFNLENCIVCDDNISKFNLMEELAPGNSNVFCKYFLSKLNDNLCISIQTASPRNKPYNDLQSKQLGSKVFAFNLKAIFQFFKTPESIFYMFLPASCVRWWGEDYFMQIMLGEIAIHLDSVNGFQKLGANYLSLERLAQNKNASKKTLSTAEDYTLNPNVFHNGIDFSKLGPQIISSIMNAFSNMTKLVEEKIKSTNKYNKYLSSLPNHKIQNICAEANNTEFSLYSSERQNVGIDEAFKMGLEKLKGLTDILYAHQVNALHTLFSSSSRIGHFKMCTGSGKTRIQIAFAHLCCNAMGLPIFIVVPTQELVEQTYQEFISTQSDFANLLDNALNKQQIIKVSSQLQNLSYKLLNNSLCKNPNVLIFCEASFKLFVKSNTYFKPAIYIFDEYHLTKKAIDKLGKLMPNGTQPIFGFSATPIRDDKHLLSKPIYIYSTKNALADKRVTPILTDYFNMFYSMESYDLMLEKVPEILRFSFHPNGKRLVDNKGIVYVNSIVDANELARTLNANGLSAFSIHSQSNDTLINNFKAQKERCVAIAVRKLRVGFDDPLVNYVINLQAPTNEDSYIQIIGRVMRILADDPHKVGYIVTFQDNCRLSSRIDVDQTELMQVSHIYRQMHHLNDRFRKLFHQCASHEADFYKFCGKVRNQSDIRQKFIVTKEYLLNQDTPLIAWLDKFNAFCSDYRQLYKQAFKAAIYDINEYKKLKKADNLLSMLKSLDEMFDKNQHDFEFENICLKTNSIAVLFNGIKKLDPLKSLPKIRPNAGVLTLEANQEIFSWDNPKLVGRPADQGLK